MGTLNVVKFRTKDEKYFDVNLDIMKCSGTVEQMVDLCPGSNTIETIYLKNINGIVFQKILDWCHHYKDDSDSDDDLDLTKKNSISDWNSDFLTIEKELLFQLLEAANFFHMKRLVAVICDKIAEMLKQKSPSQIKYILNLSTVLDEDEEFLPSF